MRLLGTQKLLGSNLQVVGALFLEKRGREDFSGNRPHRTRDRFGEDSNRVFCGSGILPRIAQVIVSIGKIFHQMLFEDKMKENILSFLKKCKPSDNKV